MVEDEAIIALTEKRWLMKEGFNVIHVTSGEDAVSRVNADPKSIDIILMDIDLGGGRMDGTQAAREILKDHNVPLLFLSSHQEKEVVDKTEQITSYGYVVKGSSPTVIIASIKMAFKLFHAHKELHAKDEQLIESQDKSNKLLELSRDAIFINQTNQIIYLNPAALKLFGAETQDQIIGKSPFDVFHSDFHEPIRYRIDNMLNKGLPVSALEEKIIRLDGKLTDVEVVAVPFIYAGQPAIQVLLRDITDRKQAEEELKRWASIFEHAKWGIISTRPESHLIDMANQEFATMHGYSIEGIKGKPVIEFFAPEARPEVMQHMQKLHETGFNSFESVHIRKDGTTFPVLIEVAAIKDSNGKIIYRAAHVKDITKQKEAEEALSESRKQLERVIKGSTNLFWDLDLEKREMIISGNTRELLPNDIEQKRPGVYDLNKIMGNIHPDDIESYRKEIKELFENRKHVYDSEYRKKSSSGEWIWVHTKGSIVEWDLDGKPLKISGTQSNITEKKVAEEKIHAINNKLQELNATKDKLLSILAHDLRGPFTGFVGLTGELANNIDNLDKNDISEFALALNSTATKIYGLLNNLLEWSRVQTGKFEFHPDNLDLHFEIEQTISLFSAASKAKDIEIIHDNPDNIFVYSDQNMLSTILRNLLSNAIKFTYPKGKVSVSYKITDGFAEISVSDTGIGMNNNTLGKIFRIDSVYSTQGTSGEHGTGFGLVLCKEMVEKNGGKIRVISIPGKGTDFTFTLPLSAMS